MVAAAIAGAAVVGGVATTAASNKQSSGARRAARTQAELQQYIFDQQQENQRPWREAGQTALNALVPLVTNYKPFDASMMYNDPGYQFRLSEGLKGLDRQAAARGGLISGSALKAAQRYGQDYASNEYTNAFNRYQTERNAQLNPLQSLAGLGQTATNQIGQAGQNYANQAGAALASGYENAANARASGYVGAANALTSALGTGLNYYQNQQYMNNLGTSGSGYQWQDISTPKVV